MAGSVYRDGRDFASTNGRYFVVYGEKELVADSLWFVMTGKVWIVVAESWKILEEYYSIYQYFLELTVIIEVNALVDSVVSKGINDCGGMR